MSTRLLPASRCCKVRGNNMRLRDTDHSLHAYKGFDDPELPVVVNLHLFVELCVISTRNCNTTRCND